MPRSDFSVKLGLSDDQLVSCTSCGLCLPHCPTYRVTGEEYASPRGRLALMSAVNKSRLASQSFVEHMELCVLCLGCETACPAGVPFGQLMEQTREAVAEAAGVSIWRRLGLRLLGRRRLLRFGFVLLGLAQRLGLVRLAQRCGIARGVRLPRIPLWQRSLRRGAAAGAPADAGALPSETVWLFTGCVMDATMRHIHQATRTVLEAAGAKVVPAPSAASCCGALHRHSGRVSQAKKLAARTVLAFTMSAPGGTAPILVNSAGCGAALKDYAALLGTAEAVEFSARVQDVHEWLAGVQACASEQAVGLVPSDQPAALVPSDQAEALVPSDQPAAPVPSDQPTPETRKPKIAVLDPCHLRHAQGAHLSVREVLRPHAEIIELDDEGLCCGAGGAYSLMHPETAAQIGQRKQQAILRSGADTVVVANPGCLLHLEADLRAQGIRICHPLELLAELLAELRHFGAGHPIMKS